MSCRYRKQCTTSTLISVKRHVLTTRPPTGDELPLVRHIWRAKTKSNCILPTFSHVCSGPAILIMSAGRSDTLAKRTCDCMTTQTCYTCPLHGEIRGRMMLFHVKHTVTLFFQFLCIPHIRAVFLISDYNFTSYTNNTYFIKRRLHCNCHRLNRWHSDSKFMT
jgi:hypothetical protein